ncbi:MAG TPA: putative addiction module antidote protein [Chromatiales bacterium]|nr:putative addiction module antidote protein [Chromatiales bacterium]
MTEIARESGLAREALYRALREGASPRFDTVLRVLRALGVRLVAEPDGRQAA